MADRVLALAVHRIEFLSAGEKQRLVDNLPSAGKLATLDFDALEEIVGTRHRQVKTFDPRPLVRAAENDERHLEKGTFRCLFLSDPDYPERLRQIYDPPFALFVRGNLPPAGAPCAAVVGTRRPSSDAVAAAIGLGTELGRERVPVVSGLAYGIDAAAHRGAVRAGGVTIAVFGCGIDRIYPHSHRSLAEAILESGGAFLSEYGTLVEPVNYHFPGRNRIISGLSQGVVVVQAPERSGALITADYALDHGRDLFVHSVGVYGNNDARPADLRRYCLGTTRLALEGAIVIAGADDLFAEWGISAEPKRYGNSGDPQFLLFQSAGAGFGPIPSARTGGEGPGAGRDHAARREHVTGRGIATGRVLAARLRDELQAAKGTLRRLGPGSRPDGREPTSGGNPVATIPGFSRSE